MDGGAGAIGGEGGGGARGGEMKIPHSFLHQFMPPPGQKMGPHRADVFCVQ